MRKTIAELLVVFIAVAAICNAGAREIRIELHLRPELAIDGTETVFVGPIMIEPREGEDVQSVDLTAARDFEIFLRNLAALAQQPEFWAAINEETHADLIVAASIDVKVLDRAGYTTEEYISPQDGKTYFRQVLVEETGFSYDILLIVVDGNTRTIIHQEQITDFMPKDERKLEEYTDMFTDLYTLQNRLVGIFVPRVVQVKRALYTN